MTSAMRRPTRTKLAATLGVLALAIVLVPRQLCGQDADPTFAGELRAQEPLAREVARAALANDGAGGGRRHFTDCASGEAAIARDMMTILGLAQIVREHPELRATYLPAMRAAAARLVDPQAFGYAARVWGTNGLASMRPGDGHAYLGYINLALGMLRSVDPDMPERALHDRLTAALADRLARAPNGLIETYPGGTWPPDVAAVAGSIGLHATVTGTDRRALLERWAGRFTACAVSSSGYLVQRVQSGTCRPLDAPRGSGTAIASYMLGFADAPLSRRLYEAVRTQGRITWLGFGGVREYPFGYHGKGDVDSGPVILGASVGATGYALGAARAHGDRDFFRELYRSATVGRTGMLFGKHLELPGGPELANALLLAMLTANRI
jgi:hypothetical protein